MNRNSDNELDFLFKSKLSAESDHDLLEIGWESMEGILPDEPKKKRGVIWLYSISGGMAASLLFFSGLYFMLHTPVKHPDSPVKAAYALHQGQSHQANRQNKAAASHVNTGSDILVNHPVATRRHALYTKNISDNEPADSVDRDGTTLQTLSLAFANEELSIDRNLPGMPTNIDSVKDVVKIADPKTPGKTIVATGTRFALAVLAAPDVNGVGSFGNNRAGIDLTVQFSLKLTRKLSISAGASYAIKPYQTGLGNYRTNHPGWSAALWTSNAKPNTVNANCYVLDVPLNINYQVYSKGKNSFAMGTGLSSYIMLKEDYRFTFPDPAKDGIDVDIANQNQHLLGVLNMNVNYQHRLNNKLGLIVQPYLKLPLTQIGFGQVNLQSAGVAVGFNWNVR